MAGPSLPASASTLGPTQVYVQPEEFQVSGGTQVAGALSRTRGRELRALARPRRATAVFQEPPSARLTM